ncbi:MAG: FAD-dependent oxidoreductase [Defluviitaleaceae bacterium]|nr:FAD-dependent oxidoreductase [Defluviitaleaceae bacterium]
MDLYEEAKRCLKCRRPPCSEHCPLKTEIPDMIRLFEAGEIKKAGELLFANNPLSAITAVVCPHDNNCKGHCVLKNKGAAVSFCEIERYASDFFLDTYEPEKPPLNGHKVAVIGAGPSGITMSVLLAMKGYKITLIEARDKIGGVLQYGIPNFRLPKDILDKYRAILDRLGVLFKPNTFVGSNITVDDMFTDGYSAVFIAVGTSRPNRFGLLGETLGNVHYAVDFLKSPSSYTLGKKTVVIGAGNVAMDAARMAVRKLKGGEVTVINNLRDEDMSANRHESNMAKIDGVRFVHQKQPVRICEDGVVCCEIVYENGQYAEDFTATEKIMADTVILAIGQGPQAAVLIGTNVAKTERGLFETDENGNTSHKGVFAAGDVVLGPKTVVEAVAFTKRVAESIDGYCKGL